MRQIAIDSLLFFICFNCACSIIMSIGLFPSYTGQLYTDPTNMEFSNILSNIIGNVGAIASTATIALVSAAALLTGHTIVGFGLIGILALSWFVRPIQWVFAGLPAAMTMYGVPSYITYTVTAIYGFVWVLFILEFIGGRDT